MVELNKSTIIENIFKNFLDLIKDNVTSVKIDDKGVTDAKTVNVQTYTSDFPAKLIDSKDNYPIISVVSPSLTSSGLNTYGKRSYEGMVDIDIFCTNAPSADKFLSSVLDTIEKNKSTLFGNGFTLVDLEDTDRDSFTRESFVTHYRRARFRIRCVYTMEDY